MNKLTSWLVSAAALLCISTAYADPVVVNDNDEGYSRLSRWEQHLDDVIADRVRRDDIDMQQAWRLQKRLDSIEAHALQSYYESDNGIDYVTFRRYASQLRDIGAQLGEQGWGRENVYGNGWYDDQTSPWNGSNGQSWSDNGGNSSYYREGDYESQCRQGNTAAGTIFGALAGGLIGGAASHGNGGAVVGGVILGGLLGNALTRDIDCDDQRYAFDAYDQSLNGDLDRDYEWRHGGHNGSFRSVREYQDNGFECRDFRVVTYKDGERYERQGTACKDASGLWRTR